MRVFDKCAVIYMILLLLFVVPALAAPEEEVISDIDDVLQSDTSAVSDSGPALSVPDIINVQIVPADGSDYMPPDDFFALYGDDYSIDLYALQTTPTSPVTAASANGLKQIVLSLLGDYSPVITQYRYQSNTSSNYTYVNDIQLDYPWLISAGIFAIVLYSVFRMGGAIFCRK